MTMQRKFILFFSSFTLLVMLVLSAVSIGFLKETYDRILHAPNASYLPVMASHMFFKATVTFIIISSVVVIISIPCGLLLTRRLSAPYLRIFKNLNVIAQQRVEIDKKMNLASDERRILEKYVGMLFDDLNNLKEYEKNKSWKDGARMLMHELKNPLTPLKLSLQKLLLNKDERIQDELKTLVTATSDIENILTCFKELVNIEFGPKESFDAIEFARVLFKEAVGAGYSFKQTDLSGMQSFPVIAEKTLLKMVYFNLVKNGLDENPADFEVVVRVNDGEMLFEFITPRRTIENIARIFKLGYSTKGDKRGFGLFLCKKISDYLDLDLKCNNQQNGVVFSIRMKKQEEFSPSREG